MKPAWDQLGQTYANSESVLIVDVDCTAAGQGVCQKVGVRGYPTIKYYLAGEKTGKDYQGAPRNSSRSCSTSSRRRRSAS